MSAQFQVQGFYIKKLIDFQKMEIEIWSRLIFEIWIIHKLSLWSSEVQHEIWARPVLSFLLFWTRKDRLTDRQAKYI